MQDAVITGINRERLHRAIDALQQVSDAHQHQLSLKEAALILGEISAEDFDQLVQPHQMVGPRQA